MRFPLPPHRRPPLSQLPRRAVQGAFALLCLWTGWEFILFMRWAQSQGAAPFAPHPPGAEAFLPISALMSLKLWLFTGRVHPVHPAGFFILTAALLTALLLKKAFCSWICPIGTLSEVLGALGARIPGARRLPPRWLDLPLRALKYLLLLFFLWAIGRMGLAALEAFLDGPYNRVADLRMYLFFARMSGAGLAVLLALALLSVLIQGFWCRYLCPYGALLGALSLLSPLRITRTGAACTGCQACTRACPARIPVHQATRVTSDECSACLRCVASCKAPGALAMRLPGGRALSPWGFALLVAGLFTSLCALGMLMGRWRSSVSPGEILRRVPEMESYRHH